MLRSFKFRLHPTPAQAERLEQWAGINRLVYNLAWEQRRDFWRQYRAAHGRGITAFDQILELTTLRAEFDFIRAAPRVSQEAAIIDLDRAFQAFFASRAQFPGPRVKGRHDTLRFKFTECFTRHLNGKWGAVHIPKVGLVKFRASRALTGAPKTVTAKLERGIWHVVFACDVGEPPAVNDLPSVGLDRGVANTISLSTGEHIRLPDFGHLERRRRKAQRVLARRKRGSRRHAKQRARVAQIYRRVASARTHALHVASASIAARFGVVAIEGLDVRAMTAKAKGKGVAQKRGLNRSILAQGWTLLASMLDYKLEAAGGRLVTVPAAYTSQTCAACGVIDARSRESQSVFACVHCGHRDHADTNAAIEIRRRSTALLPVEGGHLRPPCEAGTLAA